MQHFFAWLAEAEACAEIKYANAACLSTLDADGFPDARIILVQRGDSSDLVFITDEGSKKAEQLKRCPRAALTFYWGPLDRQVRIRGVVEVADGGSADRCFEARPTGSRITAWASSQSQPLAERQLLEDAYRQQERRWVGQQPIPRPDTWRAYRLRPERLELWRAARHRLHHRQLFERLPNGIWKSSLLFP